MTGNMKPSIKVEFADCLASPGQSIGMKGVVSKETVVLRRWGSGELIM